MHKHWSSRIVFILAGIGSVVGLGNVWRFPYLANEFGGAAFLIPYIILLLVVGVPLFSMELLIGQRSGKGPLHAFGKGRWSGVGMLALLVSFAISSYYVVILSWLVVYAVAALWLGWAANPTLFFDQMANSPVLLLVIVAVWLAVYLMLRHGLAGLERTMKWIVPLPLLLLLVLAGRVLFIPGALDGIAALVQPDLTVLLSFDVWVAALGQVFFSLSLGFGAMIAYGSYRRKHSNLVRDAMQISLSDTLVSIIAGVVVFGTLGALSLSRAVPIDQVVASGPQLAFVVLPQALLHLPFAAVVSALFFAMLFLLGLSSQVSISQAIVESVEEHSRRWTNGYSAALVCLTGAISSVGYVWLGDLIDIVDKFAVDYGLLLVAVLEVLFVVVVLRGSADKLLYRTTKNTIVRATWQYLKWLSLFIVIALFIAQFLALRGVFAEFSSHFWIGVVMMFIIVVLSMVWSFSRREN